MTTPKPTFAAAPPHEPLGIATEVLLRRVVESVRDYAIFMLDTRGYIATWNIGAERIKGYAASEILGRHFSVFYPPEEAEKCAWELEVAEREGRFEDEGWRVRRSGERFWANVIITPVRADDGTLLGFAKVTRDLTERRRIEEERAARLAAEQANRAKDDFLAMLGHELRNPLAPIVTALQLMKLRGGVPTPAELQIIERQVKHMQHLVDDLLDVSAVTRRKLVLKKKTIDLRDAIARAIEAATPMIESRHHHLSIDVPHEEVPVRADDARLTQVFINLLVNAGKYTDPGGHIDVRVQVRACEAVVEVQDDGIGMNPELAPRVFDLFTQGERVIDRAVGGLGLGLTLVQTLVQMHDGSVHAYSAGPGQGSTFTVRLPLHASSVDADAPSAAASGVLRSIHKRRVLIVDDNEDVLELLGALVARLGNEVRTALDAAEALHVVQEFRPDVALLDIGLPVMDGYALAKRLREELAPDVPKLVALSGYGQDRDRERSRLEGFAAHLVKPVDVQLLADTLNALDP